MATASQVNKMHADGASGLYTMAGMSEMDVLRGYLGPYDVGPVDPRSQIPDTTQQIGDNVDFQKYLHTTITVGLSNLKYVLSDIFTFTYHDVGTLGRDYRIKTIKFNASPIAIEAQGGMPRLLTHSQETTSGELIRHGVAIHIPTDFAYTEAGRQFVAHQIAAMQQSYAITFELAGYQALLNGRNAYRSYESHLTMDKSTIRGITDFICRRWDCMHKSPATKYEVLNRVREHMRRTADADPSILIVSSATQPSFVFETPQSTKYHENGPLAAAIRNKGSDAIDRVLGMEIRIQREYPAELFNSTRGAIQPLRRRVQIGDQIPVVDTLRHVQPEQYTSRGRIVLGFNMTANKHEKLDPITCAERSGRFDHNGDLDESPIDALEFDDTDMFRTKVGGANKTIKHWGMQEMRYFTQRDMLFQARVAVAKLAQRLSPEDRAALDAGFRLASDLSTNPGNDKLDLWVAAWRMANKNQTPGRDPEVPRVTRVPYLGNRLVVTTASGPLVIARKKRGGQGADDGAAKLLTNYAPVVGAVDNTGRHIFALSDAAAYVNGDVGTTAQDVETTIAAAVAAKHIVPLYADLPYGMGDLWNMDLLARSEGWDESITRTAAQYVVAFTRLATLVREAFPDSPIFAPPLPNWSYARPGIEHAAKLAYWLGEGGIPRVPIGAAREVAMLAALRAVDPAQDAATNQAAADTAITNGLAPGEEGYAGTTLTFDARYAIKSILARSVSPLSHTELPISEHTDSRHLWMSAAGQLVSPATYTNATTNVVPLPNAATLPTTPAGFAPLAPHNGPTNVQLENAANVCPALAERVQYMANNGRPPLETLCMLLCMCAPVTLGQLRAWYQLDMVVPIGCHVVRPFRTYAMDSGIMTSKDIGKNLYGAAHGIKQVDGSSKEILLHHTAFFDPVVIMPKEYIVVEDLCCTAYFGGEDFTPISPNTFNPRADSISGSAFYFLVSYAYTLASQTTTDISGRFDTLTLGQWGFQLMTDRANPTENWAFENARYDFSNMMTPRYSAAADSTWAFDAPSNVQNTLIFNGHALFFNPHTNTWNRVRWSEDPFGRDVYDGVGSVRCGGAEHYRDCSSSYEGIVDVGY